MIRPEVLPRWVWDVVADIVDYDANHAKGAPCIESTFVRIPEDVRRTAAIILRYRADGVLDAEIVEDPS